MMSLGSVDKVSKHSCHCSMRTQLLYDMIRLGLELMKTTTECLHLHKYRYVSYTKHFVTLGITIPETFGTCLILRGIDIEMGSCQGKALHVHCLL